MKHLVIVNPAAGRGQGAQLIPQIEQTLRAFQLDFTLQQTERAWHAAELAEAGARDGYDTIITAGGDGTFNEALNGLMKVKAEFDQIGKRLPALGALSIGTGNDFAASVNIPLSMNAAVEAIAKNQRRVIDIGTVKTNEHPEARYFGNCVGIGFDAAGTIISRRITWAKGFLAYLVSAIQTIFEYHKSAPTVEIKYDEQQSTLTTLMVSIMNGRRIGGGFWMAPAGQADDGWFDLCIADLVSKRRMFTLIPHFIKGTQATQPEIKMARAKMVSVTALKGTLPVQTDGEIICEAGTFLEVEILPKQIEVVGVVAI